MSSVADLIVSKLALPFVLGSYYPIMFIKLRVIIVNDITIHIVLKAINVGKSFLIDAQIKRDDVNSVRKWKYQSSIPNIKPGTMITALAIHAANSIML